MSPCLDERCQARQQVGQRVQDNNQTEAARARPERAEQEARRRNDRDRIGNRPQQRRVRVVSFTFAVGVFLFALIRTAMLPI